MRAKQIRSVVITSQFRYEDNTSVSSRCNKVTSRYRIDSVSNSRHIYFWQFCKWIACGVRRNRDANWDIIRDIQPGIKRG